MGINSIGGGGINVYPPEYSGDKGGLPSLNLESTQVTSFFDLFSDSTTGAKGPPEKDLQDTYFGDLLINISVSWGKNEPGSNGVSPRMSAVNTMISALQTAITGLTSILCAAASLQNLPIVRGGPPSLQPLANAMFPNESAEDALASLKNFSQGILSGANGNMERVSTDFGPAEVPKQLADLQTFLSNVEADLKTVTNSTDASFLETLGSLENQFPYSGVFEYMTSLYNSKIFPTWHD